MKKIRKVLPIIEQEYPTYRWLLLTLSSKSCQIQEVRQNLHWMVESWRRLVRQKNFPAVGWIRVTEVTRGKEKLAYPQFHCLLLVKSSYFGHNYLSHQKWVALWQSSLRVDYSPMLSSLTIKKEQRLVLEIFRFCCQTPEFNQNDDWLIQLAPQLNRVKTLATGGIIKQYIQQFNLHNPEKLVEPTEDANEIDDGYLYLNWNKNNAHPQNHHQ